MVLEIPEDAFGNRGHIIPVANQTRPRTRQGN
jgi:hypothetical protein